MTLKKYLKRFVSARL